MTVFSSREFNQDISRVKRAADEGPVIITDRGTPHYVLLRHDAYRRLVDGGPSIRDMLDHPGSMDIEFDPSPVGIPQVRTVDFERYFCSIPTCCRN